MSFSCVRYGWHSIWRRMHANTNISSSIVTHYPETFTTGCSSCFCTWWTAGLYLRPGLLSMASVWSLLKLEIPMALTNPASTSSSIACTHGATLALAVEIIRSRVILHLSQLPPRCPRSCCRRNRPDRPHQQGKSRPLAAAVKTKITLRT